jgi:tetratricopeptide (TPR) repeat protein
MFAKAIDIDPGYALAFTGIADCHSLLYMYFDSRPKNLDKAIEASRRALELNPLLAEAHVARGLAASLKKNFAEAELEFQEAIRLDPTLFEARYFYGRTCRSQGKHLESAQLFEEACQLRPDDYQAATHLPGAYTALGRDADAQAAQQRALDVVTRHLEVNSNDARALYLGAICCCQLGHSEQGLEWAGRALALDPDDSVTLYNVACVNAVQGRIEPALDCLERALKQGFAHKEWIENDTDLASLHQHPRFEAILRKL